MALTSSKPRNKRNGISSPSVSRLSQNSWRRCVGRNANSLIPCNMLFRLLRQTSSLISNCSLIRMTVSTISRTMCGRISMPRASGCRDMACMTAQAENSSRDTAPRTQDADIRLVQIREVLSSHGTVHRYCGGQALAWISVQERQNPICEP